ncbi:bifunctional oligoribonuclease/PAP phosphatase NrnA [Muribaculaceae bacterium Isolate-039 (Harlan)]|mgnify:FL=1|jgi:phosphoesterase RecJ-like protein|uniref:DHH family phosphoesterase n=1 Tax=Duncaniella TaxID=2518495 RepID=UPI000F4899F7|nr:MULTISPECIES: bifunctional oligoribonuclease/PAP phosphatase NrnA [Duncaniella]NBH91816.1 bifunctional oligoribonuclease/PAP phosphatase NrnA [Muribaculaceae bacterium S4]NBI20228.1 bifunctional oligoribonuclease/PAP phosphatase NrnA [Muribaculaceae bacterium Z1]ROS91539.1 bifunctional oligoribonuclease/PAP phosphatase NrnA [Muribaculaceae bacterium Isolate-039 (Harlan)]ROS95261.1 bifunctional oligoribonuclease/PAP phosphatase NrnA [Muribaculaceae bacterium Isolate-077 (Janvier)]ROS98311.1 
MAEFKRHSRFFTELDPAVVDRVKQFVLASRNIVITCHVSPDGDALGSSCALWFILKALGKNATVVTADCAPRSLQFLPGVREIVAATRNGDRVHDLIADADLIFCLDFNDITRVDRLSDAISKSPAKKVVIDHHLDPRIEGEIVISRPEISSTSALLYIFMWQAGWTRHLTRNSAACIYTGMMTDTGNFSYNSNDPDLYLIIHDLMRKGIDKDNLYKLVMNTSSESRIRIMGFAQYRMQILQPHRAAVIMLSEDELKEFGYSKGDTEGLVNIPLSMPEVTYSVFLREDAKNCVKVSMRSKGEFSVSRICEEHFGGGGHTNAAGGEFNGPLDKALQKLLEIIPTYDKYLQ